MLKLIIAALVIWALMTSGYRVGDVANAVTAWTIEHVQDHLGPRASSPRPESGNGPMVFSTRSEKS